MTRALPILVGLLALGCSPSTPSPTSPTSPATSATAASAPSTWTLSVSMDTEDCEIAKGAEGIRWRCGTGPFTTVREDAAEVVRRVEAIEWAAEAAKTEPAEAGTKRRRFRLERGDGAIEVLRYPSPSSSIGELGAAFDALITAERRPAPTPSNSPREFPPVSDRGLVTIQQMSLVDDSPVSTLRVGADGTWSSMSTETKTGELDATQLAAVQTLLKEAASAKTDDARNAPCDAVPSQAARVLFDNDREVGWSGPCAGPPPPEQFGTLLRYLRQVVEGRPATELEQTLRLRPRP